MSADALSQEEIDALLRGAGGGETTTSKPTATSGFALNPKQSEGAKKYAERMASTLGDMIGTYLSLTCKVSAKDPRGATASDAAKTISGPLVLCMFNYNAGFSSHTALIFNIQDACKIGGIMVGNPEATEFADMVADAFKEVVNTVLGNLNTSLSSAIGTAVRNSALEVEPAEASADTLSASIGGGDTFGWVTYSISIAGTLEGEIHQLFSLDMLDSLSAFSKPTSPPKPVAPREEAPQIKARPVEFESLSNEPPSKPAPPNLELLMDIGLEIRVELGRTHLKIRDVLNLGGGSVVELDKLAGEPVDLLVNDIIFAKGEVVVIDENFGVRITDILSLDERVKTLGERKD